MDKQRAKKQWWGQSTERMEKGSIKKLLLKRMGDDEEEGGKKGVSQVILKSMRKFERPHFTWLQYIRTEAEDEITAAPENTGSRRECENWSTLQPIIYIPHDYQALKIICYLDIYYSKEIN